METMLQLLYLSFEAPRFDANIFNILRTQYKNRLQKHQKDNDNAFNDTVALANSNHNPYTFIFNEKFLENIDLKKEENIYRDRIGNAANFIFVLLGTYRSPLLD